MKNSRLVYSTETGRVSQKKDSENVQGDETIRIFREKKGRRGKGVTILSGFNKNQADLKALAKTLKQKCSSGGTVKNNTIEIQGEHTQMLNDNLLKLGYKTKLYNC
mgnify:CR=1 FL=1